MDLPGKAEATGGLCDRMSRGLCQNGGEGETLGSPLAGQGGRRLGNCPLPEASAWRIPHEIRDFTHRGEQVWLVSGETVGGPV